MTAGVSRTGAHVTHGCLGGVLPVHLHIPRQDDLPHRRDHGPQRATPSLQLWLLLRQTHDRNGTHAHANQRYRAHLFVGRLRLWV